MARLISPALGAFLAVFLGFVLPAKAAPLLVVDAYSGQVISASEATRPWFPASTTKMMTAYVALKAIKSGRVGLETAIPVSKLAASQRPVKLGLRPGSEMTLDTALKIMMVKSANDVAYVIAEGVGGSVDQFVAMMNAEARALGMRETRFANPNGWHHPDQQTSARDLAILARSLLIEFPEYRDYWGIGAVQVGARVLNNTNALVGRYSGIEGMKTGFVCASGFNLVATATRGGRTLIAVALGTYSGAERALRAAELLDQGFSGSGTGATLASLPGSGYSNAPNICAELRQANRGRALSDDGDFSGMISSGQQAATIAFRNSDAYNPALEHIYAQNQASAAPARRGLGPRASFAPLVLALGRSAGSASAPPAANTAFAQKPAPAQGTALAGRPTAPSTRTGTLPASASAFAATDRETPELDPVMSKPVTANAGSPLSLQSALERGKPATGKTVQTKPASAAKPQAKTAQAKPAPNGKPTVSAKPAQNKPATTIPAPQARPKTLVPKPADE